MCANFYFAEMAPDGRCPAATLRISFLIQASAIVSQSSKFLRTGRRPESAVFDNSQSIDVPT